jgi:ankyrin repeat protein
MIRLLVAHGANINAVDGLDLTPLAMAMSDRQGTLVMWLLWSGADAKGLPGAKSPLMQAVTYGVSPTVASVLLAHGANVNQRGPGGWTALDYAASRNDGAWVNWLLEHGADPSIKADDGLPAQARATSPDVRRLFNKGSKK